MKPFQLTLSLAAALAAMPAMAQDNGAPQNQIRFEIGDQDADFCLALVALENGTIPFLGDHVLANALVLVLHKEDGSFVCDMDLPMQTDADLYWQGVSWDMVDGLKIYPVQKVAHDGDDNIIDESFDAAAGPGDVPDAAGEPPVAGQVMGAGIEPASKKDDGGSAEDPLPIELSFLPADDGSPSSVLQAKLIGPTSDYGLSLVHVRVDTTDDAGGKADVYLYRKVPGEGEGMLDIVEEHTVTADLSGAKTIRVFLATGTQSKPGAATAWRFLTALSQ
jgi:hypothetical protein